MRLRHLTLLCALGAPACALVSGLSSLDVGGDASVVVDGATTDGAPIDVAAGDAPRDGASVDASDGGVIVTVDGGVDAPVDSGTPGALRCGNVLTCNANTQTCCSVQSVTSCVNGTSMPCVGDASVVTIHCDYTAQCKNGEVCCGKFTGLTSGASACALAINCTDITTLRLCRTSGECDGGTCSALPSSSGVSWLSYCK